MLSSVKKERRRRFALKPTEQMRPPKRAKSVRGELPLPLSCSGSACAADSTPSGACRPQSRLTAARLPRWKSSLEGGGWMLCRGVLEVDVAEQLKAE